MDLKLLSEKIKAARESAGMSQEEAAHRADQMSVKTFQRIERGEEENPKIGTLFAIATALKCDITDLVSPKTSLAIKMAKQSQMEKSGIKLAADILETFLGLSPPRQQTVLAILYKDASHVKGLPDKVTQALQVLLKAL